jgi:hypothetical protein
LIWNFFSLVSTIRAVREEAMMRKLIMTRLASDRKPVSSLLLPLILLPMLLRLLPVAAS